MSCKKTKEKRNGKEKGGRSELQMRKMEETIGRMNARQRENKKKVGLLPGVTSYDSNTFQ